MANTRWLCLPQHPAPTSPRSCDVGCEGGIPCAASTCSHGNSASQNPLEIVAEEGPWFPTPTLQFHFQGWFSQASAERSKSRREGWRLKPRGAERGRSIRSLPWVSDLAKMFQTLQGADEGGRA